MIQRLKEIVRHPVETGKWWKWQLTKNTVCRWFGHKQERVDEILGCCGRCYETMPQQEDQRELFRSAIQEAWDRAEANLTKEEPS